MRGAIIAICAASAIGAAAPGLAGCQQSDVSRSIGARCDVSSECDQRCLPPGTDYPGGFCTIACTSPTDCPNGTKCADRLGGICLFGCTVDADCTFLGMGWTCRPVDLHGGGIKVMVCAGS